MAGGCAAMVVPSERGGLGLAKVPPGRNSSRGITQRQSFCRQSVGKGCIASQAVTSDFVKPIRYPPNIAARGTIPSGLMMSNR